MHLRNFKMFETWALNKSKENTEWYFFFSDKTDTERKTWKLNLALIFMSGCLLKLNNQIHLLYYDPAVTVIRHVSS